MAVQSFEEILAAAQLSADERKLIDNIKQKVPEFEKGYLRQDDYSRKTQELATERKKLESDIEYAKKMKDWADEKVPIWESLVEQGVIDEESKPIWPEEKKRMQEALEEAKKAIGGDMDPAELDKRVKAIVAESGLKLTAEEWKNVYATEGQKLVEEQINTRFKAEETKFNENTIPFVSGFSTGVAIQAIKYEQETGKPWTKDNHKELLALMTKEQKFDPYEVGEMYLAPHRQAKATEKEIEKRAQEIADKKLKDMGAMPGGGSEGYIPQGQARGSLQKMLEESAAAEGDIESLAMAASRKAAGELRAEGKS